MRIKITNKKNIILTIVLLIMVIVIIAVLVNFSRTSKINEQLLNYINEDNKITILFNNGKNIKINNEVYEKLKSQCIDVVIYNEMYIATIKSNDLQQYMNINVKVKKDGFFKDSYNVVIDSNVKCDIKVNAKKTLGNVSYISQYDIQNDNLNMIANDILVEDNGFFNIIKQGNSNKYLIAYIEPTQINIQDIVMKNRTQKEINIGIEKSEYTKGSFYIECNDKEAIDVDDTIITAKKSGEYKLKISTNSNSLSKEINLNIQEVADSIQLSKSDVELEVGKSLKVEATVLPQEAVNKDLTWTSTNENIATVTQDGTITAINEGNCQINVSTIEEPVITNQINVNVKSISKVNYYTYNTSELTYVNGILLVNKNHPVPSDYAPGLQEDAYNAFLELSKDAAAVGFDIQILSGYRSYKTQDKLYNNYVSVYGQAEADTFSARPGTSEHQTGLAMDVGWIDDTYGETPSGIWLAKNCYKYGFIIRYPKGKENVTGYKYEPWHIRYLGKDVAEAVYNSGLCLEEYLGVY